MWEDLWEFSWFSESQSFSHSVKTSGIDHIVVLQTPASRKRCSFGLTKISFYQNNSLYLVGMVVDLRHKNSHIGELYCQISITRLANRIECTVNFSWENHLGIIRFYIRFDKCSLHFYNVVNSYYGFYNVLLHLCIMQM